ncbi:cyclic 2,3-diphosphoglycerate synthase [soil metagenome]
MSAERVLILGAAGRDFHLFNTVFRGDPGVKVVAFTAQQIPGIADRRYPAELAGEGYPEGIPIHAESDLEACIESLAVDRCLLAYSDLSHEEVMHLASRVNAAGAAFELPSPQRSMLPCDLPVIAVCASRTGAGKSQTVRAIVKLLRDRGHRVAVLRHPMPYGDLAAQKVQRFATDQDLVDHHVTIEEREEYEPHIAAGSVVWAGVDYEAILAEARKDADVVVWDGGNNDTSFLEADLLVTVVDPHRPGHELLYHPGETNVLMADVVLINKVDTARNEDVIAIRRNVRRVNPDALVVEAASPLQVDDPELIRGRRVLVIEDGPTLTHGGMAYGAGTLAALRCGASEMVDPREFAVGKILEVLETWPHLGPVLPAMGYGAEQVANLENTLQLAKESRSVHAIVVGTPIALDRVVRIPLPHTRVRYELQVLGSPTLEDALAPVLSALEA